MHININKNANKLDIYKGENKFMDDYASIVLRCDNDSFQYDVNKNDAIGIINKLIDIFHLKAPNICNHVIEEQQSDKYGNYKQVMYSKCEEKFELWYCEKSPDHRCYYYTDGKDEQGYYVLDINNNKIYIEGHTDKDEEYESDDCCLFCGQPEERKWC